MKAWVLHGINDLRFETVEEPELENGEALVAVKAAAICGSDISRIYRTGTYSYPLIPGHEFAGIVVKTKEAADHKWLGRRVAVFPLIPCGKCEPCQKGQYEMCRHYRYLGSRQNGGFAEYAAVPVRNLLELPEGVPMETAAMMEPVAVAVHSVRRVLPQKNETVTVCGLGTIGMLVFMILREAGIKNILAVGNKEYQKQVVLKAGLSEENYCDGSRQAAGEWLMKRTGGQGTEVFFECVGKNETLVQAVNGVAPGGRICLVGNPFSDMILEKNVYWKILRNQLMVTGTWNSFFNREAGDDWHYALDKIAREKITPGQLISHRFPLEKLASGLEIMRDKREDYIKIMVTM